MTDEFAPGSMFDGRYEILHHVGSGGMGSVYKARETELNRIVALKVLQDVLADKSDAYARFRREGQILSKLPHPNIVTLYRLGRCNGKLYIAIEYLEGQSLLDLLEREKRLTAQQMLAIAIQICAAMDYAHRQGVVHRDLKPNNVMLVNTPHINFVKVLDFGLARIVARTAESNQQLTRTGTVIGSVFYMSPEQCQGKRAEEPADIYALGCILFEMLTGSPPFYSDSSVGLMYKHVNSPIPELPTSVAESQELAGLNHVIRRCLAKSPQARYATMAALSSDLQSVASGRSVEVVPFSAEVEGTKTSYVQFAVISALAGCASLLVCAVFMKQRIELVQHAERSAMTRNLSYRLPFAEHISKDPRVRVEAVEGWLAHYGKSAPVEALMRAHDYLVKDTWTLGREEACIDHHFELAQAYFEKLISDSSFYKKLTPPQLAHALDDHLRATEAAKGILRALSNSKIAYEKVWAYLDVHDRAFYTRRLANQARDLRDLPTEEKWLRLSTDGGDSVDYALLSRCLYLQGKSADATRCLDHAVQLLYNIGSANAVHRVAEELVSQGRVTEALDVCDLCGADFDQSLYLSGQSKRIGAGSAASNSQSLTCTESWRHEVLLWRSLMLAGKHKAAVGYLKECLQQASISQRWLLFVAAISGADDKSVGAVLEENERVPPPVDDPTLTVMLVSAARLLDERPRLAAFLVNKCLEAKSASGVWLQVHVCPIVDVLLATGENQRALDLCRSVARQLYMVPIGSRTDICTILSAQHMLAASRLGLNSEADEVFQSALPAVKKEHELSVGHAVLLAARAEILSAQGKDAEAKKYFEEAVKIADLASMPIEARRRFYRVYAKMVRAKGDAKLADVLEDKVRINWNAAQTDPVLDVLRFDGGL